MSMKNFKNAAEGKRTREFAPDKPRNCSYCFFYDEEQAACVIGGLDNCYYRLIPSKKKEDPCEGCSYSKGRPCIGYCTVEVNEYFRNKKGKEGK